MNWAYQERITSSENTGDVRVEKKCTRASASLNEVIRFPTCKDRRALSREKSRHSGGGAQTDIRGLG